MKMINIYSFFSGAGFLDLGFENNGYSINYVNEYNESFLNVYKYARDKMKISDPKYGYFCSDINALLEGNEKKILQERIACDRKNGLIGFIGGPPCPDFSIAGKNKGITGKWG